MCTLFIAIHQHPDFPLLIVGNRDEFYARPTAALALRDGVYAGKDLKQGGYWLAVNKQTGQFAALTNVRQQGWVVEGEPISRGHLVKNFVEHQYLIQDYIEQLSAEDGRYEGFNLLLGSVAGEVACYSNVTGRTHYLQSGLYGLSNASLDAPWPKLLKGKQALNDLLTQDYVKEDTLLKLLKNRHVYTDKQLPSTGVPLRLERMLSALFIASPVYGTRSSALISVRANNEVRFVEQTYGLMGRTKGRKTEVFTLPR